MRHQHVPAVLFVSAALVAAFALPSRGDVLTTADDQLIDGKLIGFQDGSFRFETGEGVQRYPADQVRSISITPAVSTGAGAPDASSQMMLQQLSQSLAVLHQRFDGLQYQIDQMAAVQGAKMDNLQQRSYELNPISRMTVEEQSSSYSRNGDFVIQGFIRNYSGVMVYNPEVQIDLVGPNNEPVFSEVVEANVSSVGPNSRARFRATIPSPPRFEVYYVTPVLTHGSDPRMERPLSPSYLDSRGRERGTRR